MRPQPIEQTGGGRAEPRLYGSTVCAICASRRQGGLKIQALRNAEGWVAEELRPRVSGLELLPRLDERPVL